MSWYYNSNLGAVQDLPDPLGWTYLHSGLGWHGPFDTKDAAIAFYNNGKKDNPGWRAPTDLAGNLLNVGNTATSIVTTPITDLASGIKGAIEAVFNIAIRFMEATVGIVMLAIAANVILKQATGVDVAGRAYRTGKRVGTTAAKAAAVA